MYPRTERIQDLSGLFLLSSILGLMPCADDDSLNRRLTAYAVITHAAYRITNIAILVYFLMVTETSLSLMILVAAGSVMKFLCAAVHLLAVVKYRRRLLKLVENCDISVFNRNVYRTLTKCCLLWMLYLYVAAQIIQWRWQAVIRDVFSMLDVFIPIQIILQFCTFLTIAADRFKTSRMRLVVLFYRRRVEVYQNDVIDGIVDEHIRNLDMVADLHDCYTHQMLCCVCFLGFDFFVAAYDTVEHFITAKNLIQTVTTTSYCTLCLTTIMILGRACEATKKKVCSSKQEGSN